MRDQAVVAVQSDSFGQSIVEQPLFSSVTMEARLQGLEMITGPNSGGWFRGTPFRSPLQGGLKGLGARGGVFLLEVQYSILKSLISTCVLSYVGSREDWLLDRICES